MEWSQGSICWKRNSGNPGQHGFPGFGVVLFKRTAEGYNERHFRQLTPHTGAYIKGAGLSGSDLALKHNVRTVLVAPPRAFPSEPRGRRGPFRRTTPTSSRYQHGVLQGLQDRGAIFQHGLHGVELSEFSETEKRDDRERER